MSEHVRWRIKIKGWGWGRMVEHEIERQVMKIRLDITDDNSKVDLRPTSLTDLSHTYNDDDVTHVLFPLLHFQCPSLSSWKKGEINVIFHLQMIRRH